MSAPGFVQPLRTLAAMTRQTNRITVNSVSVAEDGALVVAMPAPPAHFGFRFDGLRYTVTVTPSLEGFRYRLTATIGQVPFTVENRAARVTLLCLLGGCRQLDPLHFVIAGEQRLCLVAESEVGESPTADAVIFELVTLLHRARPYLGLLRNHLAA